MSAAIPRGSTPANRCAHRGAWLSNVMGIDQKIVFPSGNLPTWSQFADLCAARQVPVQLRMIDGELALPDETPPHDWRELRVGTPGGMVTLKRESDGITIVIWGN